MRNAERETPVQWSRHKHVQNRETYSLLLIPLLLAGNPSPVQTAPTAGDVAAQKLFDRYFSWRLQDNPEFATQVGNHSYDDRLTAVSFRSRRARLLRMESFRTQLDNLANNDLSYHTKVSVSILREKIRTYVDGDHQKGYLFPVSYLSNSATSIRMLLKHMHFNTEEDYRKLLKRYKAFPEKIQDIISLLRIGIEEDMVLHKTSTETVPEQLRELNVSVQESEFFAPFQSMPIAIREPVRSELRTAGEQAVRGEVLDQLLKLADFIESEYLPHSRKEVSVSSLPNGEEFYAACLRFHTTTDLTAEEIHQMGLNEVDRIESEMEKIAASQGFRGGISAFSEQLRSDPSNFYSNPEEMLHDINSIIEKRIQPHLPSVVWQLPKDDVIVEEESSVENVEEFASYQVPGLNGSLPGKVKVNTSSKPPKYEMLGRVLHGTNPGYHLFFSVLKNNAGLPKFQRVYGDSSPHSMAPSGIPSNIAIVEGWALYAETLGEAMNLYEDHPIDRYGDYSLELYRACSLVVDTGLHAFNWTQQKAVEYMMTHTTASQARIENEVRRFITWPGQAAAYKVGELHLKDLRSSAIVQLDTKFDLRTFHQVVLDCAGPLTVVERCVNKYIGDNGVWRTSALKAGAGSAAHSGYRLVLLTSMAVWCFSRRWQLQVR